MSTGYDYTTEQDQDNYGDIPLNAMEMRSAEEIERENLILDIPIGEHELEVKKIMKAEDVMHRVTVDGSQRAYNTTQITLQFCLPSNPSCVIQDSFVLPPRTPLEKIAYTSGKNEKGLAGFHANKYQHFFQKIAKVGASGSVIPITKTGDFVGGKVIATVVDGGTYIDKKTGQEKKGYNRIKLFSYRSILDGIPAAGVGKPSAVSASPASPPQASRPPVHGSETVHSAPTVSRPAGLSSI